MVLERPEPGFLGSLLMNSLFELSSRFLQKIVLAFRADIEIRDADCLVTGFQPADDFHVGLGHSEDLFSS